MQVTFFGQIWLQRQFKRGSQVVLSGKVELFRGQLMMTNPEWEMLERENLHTRRIVPVYPLTKGLSARTMRRLMHQTVERVEQNAFPITCRRACWNAPICPIWAGRSNRSTSRIHSKRSIMRANA